MVLLVNTQLELAHSLGSVLTSLSLKMSCFLQLFSNHNLFSRIPDLLFCFLTKLFWLSIPWQIALLSLFEETAKTKNKTCFSWMTLELYLSVRLTITTHGFHGPRTWLPEASLRDLLTKIQNISVYYTVITHWLIFLSIQFLHVQKGLLIKLDQWGVENIQCYITVKMWTVSIIINPQFRLG